MGNRTAKFSTTAGDFSIELFEDKSPKTTANFVTLIEKGFYNDLVFHRVIENFMIQGGCPDGTGMGGPGYQIDDEFHDDLTHDVPGILSMANAGPNTGGSQFFITLVPTTWLDGKHAIFGKVSEGMDIIEKIGKTETGMGDKPVTEIKITTVTVG